MGSIDEARARQERLLGYSTYQDPVEYYRDRIIVYAETEWQDLGYNTPAGYWKGKTPLQPRLSPDQRQVVFTLGKEVGMTDEELHDLTGYGEATIKRSRSFNGSNEPKNDLGQRSPAGHLPPELHDQMVARAAELREGGQTFDSISTELGVSRSTVRRWLQPSQQPKPKPQPEPVAEREVPPLKPHIDSFLVRQIGALAVRMDNEEWTSSFAALVVEARAKGDQNWFKEMDAALETIYSVSSRMLEQVRKPETEPARVLGDQNERDSRFPNTHERRVKLMKMQNVAG